MCSEVAEVARHQAKEMDLVPAHVSERRLSPLAAPVRWQGDPRPLARASMHIPILNWNGCFGRLVEV